MISSTFRPDGMHVFFRDPAGPEQEFEPFRPPPLGADLTAAEKISFGHHADQSPLCIDDRQAADPVLQHQPSGFEDRSSGRSEMTFAS